MVQAVTPRFVYPGEQKRAIGEKAIACQQAGLLRRYPNMERVEVPYEGKSLPAYFMKAPGAGGKTPTVVTPSFLHVRAMRDQQVAARGDQNIRRFDVAVDDAVRVRVVEGGGKRRRGIDPPGDDVLSRLPGKWERIRVARYPYYNRWGWGLNGIWRRREYVRQDAPATAPQPAATLPVTSPWTKRSARIAPSALMAVSRASATRTRPGCTT